MKENDLVVFTRFLLTWVHPTFVWVDEHVAG
jgi:hypothetical protein